MKTSLSFALLTLVSAGHLLAQAPAAPTAPGTVNHAETAGASVPAIRDMKGNVKSPDGLAMVKGSLTYIKDGKPTLVSSELKLSEGLVAKPNGEVTTRDGKTIKLAEGQMITLDGQMTQAPLTLGSTAPGAASTQTPETGNKIKYGNGNVPR